MKEYCSITLAFFVLVWVGPSSAQNSSVKVQSASMPLSFTQNNGQWPESVLFRASAGGAPMWFTSSGIYHQFTRRIEVTGYRLDILTDHHFLDKRGDDRDSIEISMIKSEFIGSNPNPEVIGQNEMAYKCNYILGNIPEMWRTDVQNFESILYRDIYPGIDLKYYGNGRQLEYDLIVSPGADFSQIQIRYDGIESLSVAENGDLLICMPFGEMTELRPKIYQVVDNCKSTSNGNYVLTGENTFGFELKDVFNPQFAVVIDPVIVFSTYMGGSGRDYGYGIAVDATGSVYTAGETESTDFPILNPFQGIYQGGVFDVMISKFSSDGASLVFSTYIGGDSTDGTISIALDNSGASYVTGWTASPDFPTLSPIQSAYQGGVYDGFVLKLSNSGNTLIYGTYLGGSETDYGNCVKVDAVGASYVLGYTESSNFPTSNPFLGIYPGNGDAFVTKLNSAGDSLAYSTYLGGSSFDFGYNMALGSAAEAFVAGYTSSTDYPILDSYQNSLIGTYDSFITKLSGDGDSLIYSTFFGGSSSDAIVGIDVDATGAVYVYGQTLSTDLPTVNPFQGTNQGDRDAFVSKFSSTGDSLIYSTYLGGDSSEYPYNIAVDSGGLAHVAGYTFSTNFPTLNSFQSTSQGMEEGFVTKLTSFGNSLNYSTYLGGNGIDLCANVVVDSLGDAYISGGTTSTDFPTLNPYQLFLDGPFDGTITKFDCCIGLRGDLNGDLIEANIQDLTYIIDRIFRNGPPVGCEKEGDVNSDGSSVNIVDLTFLVDRIFRSGPLPGSC